MLDAGHVLLDRYRTRPTTLIIRQGFRFNVMVGRDIGTVVMPDAPVKLWVTASSMERARRRFDERLDAANRSVDDVRAEIEARDRRDTGREVSPLRRAEDAVTLATDAISPARAVCEAERIVAGRILGSGVRSGPLDR